MLVLHIFQINSLHVLYVYFGLILIIMQKYL